MKKMILTLLMVLSVAAFGYLRMSHFSKNTASTINTTDFSMQYYGPQLVSASFVALQDRVSNQIGDSCIEQGQICTLNGTPCCDPYKCKGTFPNTTCQ